MAKKAKQQPRSQNNAAQTPQKRFALRYVAFAVLVVALAGLALQIPGWLAQLEATQFTDLTVRGRLQHVEPAQVHALAKPYLQAGFMAVDMAALQQAVEALPWVARARVRREWPGRMIITVQEETPAAIWNGSQFINAYGEVFLHNIQSYDPADLPQLAGPNGTQTILLAAYAEMKKLLNHRNADLEKVSLSDRRAWRLMISKLKPDHAINKTDSTENSVTSKRAKPQSDTKAIEVYLGSELVEQRLARFVRAAWPVLQPRIQQIDYVDMRYTNGFAVGSDVKTGV